RNSGSTAMKQRTRKFHEIRSSDTLGPEFCAGYSGMSATRNPGSRLREKLLWAFMILSIFAVTMSAQVIKIINEYPADGSNGAPYVIASGPDGALWFDTAGNANDIESITTSGVITVVGSTGTQWGVMGEITTGSDGALWSVNDQANYI